MLRDLFSVFLSLTASLLQLVLAYYLSLLLTYVWSFAHEMMNLGCECEIEVYVTLKLSGDSIFQY